MADSDSLTADTAATSQPQLTWEENIRQTLTGMVGESMFQTSQLGMIVWDLTTDSCLFSYNERQRLRPASTQKVVTAIAALDLLGADYIFTTSLSATGEVVDSTATLQGNIVCKGTMDPLFGNSDMNEFVNSVKQLGIKTISGRIVARRQLQRHHTLGRRLVLGRRQPVALSAARRAQRQLRRDTAPAPAARRHHR